MCELIFERGSSACQQQPKQLQPTSKSSSQESDRLSEPQLSWFLHGPSHGPAAAVAEAKRKRSPMAITGDLRGAEQYSSYFRNALRRKGVPTDVQVTVNI